MSSHKIEPELCPCAGGRGLPGLGASGGNEQTGVQVVGWDHTDQPLRDFLAWSLGSYPSCRPLPAAGTAYGGWVDCGRRTRGFVRLCITASRKGGQQANFFHEGSARNSFFFFG